MTQMHGKKWTRRALWGVAGVAAMQVGVAGAQQAPANLAEPQRRMAAAIA